MKLAGFRPLLIAAASATMLLSVAGGAQAATAQSDPIAALRASTNPFSTLDKMTDSQQQEALTQLNALGEDEAQKIFKTQSQSGPVSRAAGYYNDLAWGTLEKAACIVDVDLVSCNRASANAQTAADSAGKLYANNGLHNGKGDAYRHAYWNALMAKSVGVIAATKIATNHEYTANGPAAERAMDLANNETGRNIGRVSASDASSQSQIKLLADTGRLKTL